MSKKLICIDSNYKLLSNLGGEMNSLLKSDDFLFASTCDLARRVASNLEGDEPIYVCGCDDMEPVNLCAALVKDRPTASISLVVDKNTGSVSTRAGAAGIKYIMSVDEFLNTLSLFSDIPNLECSCNVISLDVAGNNRQNLACTSNYSSGGTSEHLACEMSALSDSCESGELSDKSEVEIRDSNCWIMSVFSGSGGVGKSTISTISANLLSALGKRVLLADFDLQFGDLSFISGATKILTFDELERDMSILKEVVQEEEQSSFVLLKSPDKIEDSEKISALANDYIVSASHCFDSIIINTGASWNDLHADLLKLSDCSLFVVDQKASSVRSCKHALDLVSRLNISNQSLSFALNRCSKKSMLCGLDIVGALDISSAFELSDGGSAVEELLSTGKINELLKAKNPLAVSVFNMLCKLSPLCKQKSENVSKQKKSRWHN